MCPLSAASKSGEKLANPVSVAVRSLVRIARRWPSVYGNLKFGMSAAVLTVGTGGGGWTVTYVPWYWASTPPTSGTVATIGDDRDTSRTTGGGGNGPCASAGASAASSKPTAATTTITNRVLMA